MTDTQGAAETVRVSLHERSYDIVIGDGLLAGCGRPIAGLWPPDRNRRQAVIVTDEVVGPLHADTVMAALDGAGIAAQLLTVPAGEQAKCWDTLGRLVDDILAIGIERASMLVALGGGVVGDLTGFAAAIALRGLDFVQMPTTLLAQVDSSVGGKTGINAGHGKNLIGAFHQPRLVLADLGTLDTLPARERRAGYAEVVKYGCIDRPDFFAWLEGNGQAALAGDRPRLRHAVGESCRAKADVVAADERERGRRALLNLGHTFGHALEAEFGYSGRLLHGEAIAIGMVMAFDLSVSLGLCPPTDAARLRRHLTQAGLPTTLPPHPDGAWSAERLLAHMGKDKKVADGRLTFILARGIGAAFVARDVPAEAVAGQLNQAIAA
ncbi:MAG: 3-dehydroquinate synthase [Azospirillaceae bacterium]